MSRPKIGVVVAAVVAALTAGAYFLAAGRLDAGVRRDLEMRVTRAEALLTQISSLEAFDIMARAQGFARDDAARRAIEDPAVRDQAGREAIRRFLKSLSPSADKPDFVAIVDSKGAVVAADAPIPDSDDLKSRFKAVAAALDHGQVSKDIWDYGKSTVRVGVAPVLGAGGLPVGAAIVAHAINAHDAQDHAAALGTDIVFFSGDRLVATSFRRAVEEDLGKYPELQRVAHDAASGAKVQAVEAVVGGETYLVSAGALPLNFDNRAAGAIVLGSLDAARGQFSAVKVIIVILGIATLLVALFAMWVTSRVILHQSDDIEAGVGEIINGDVDYLFRPVGADLDGLANGLNVMLARLLGRPEPTEESFDVSAPARVILSEASGAIPAAAGPRMSSEADVVALAQEPEAVYVHRLYDEYIAARRSLGENVDGVTFETFGAKLRLSEANLRKKYACKAVRFRVQMKDKQVTLKPVPIL